MHLPRWNCVVFSTGKFGETVVKSFRIPEQHAVAGFSEFSQNSYISECDKTSHGGRPKYIVTVSSTVSVDPNGFAFETPRAICTYAEFMTNPLRAPEIITPGFVLNRLVRGVMYMRSIHVAHGDIKPANIFIYRNNVVFGDFGHAKLFLKGHDLARQTPSGTEGYRHPWPADKIHPQIGDVISLAVVFADSLIPKGRARLLSEDARIAIGQTGTTQERFEEFIESKIRGPAGSKYLKYLLPAFRRHPHAIACRMDADRALASLRAATEDMLANEKVDLKRRLENQGKAPPNKRVKSQAAHPPQAAPAPEPKTLTRSQKRNRLNRAAKKRKRAKLAQPDLGS